MLPLFTSFTTTTITMTSRSIVSNQSAIPYEFRFALSRLLAILYANIDHEALHAAKVQGGPIGSDTVSGVSLESSETLSQSQGALSSFEYPEELTMHIVLADTLQYLQLVTFGCVVSHRAHDYSFEELAVNLDRILPADEEGLLQRMLKNVFAQLATGNRPLEPIARYVSLFEFLHPPVFLSFRVRQSNSQQFH